MIYGFLTIACELMFWVTERSSPLLFLLTGCSKWSFVTYSQSSQPLLIHFQDVAACAAERTFWLQSQASQNSNGKIEEIAIRVVDVRRSPLWLCTHSRCWYIWTELFIIQAEGFSLPEDWLSRGPSQGERNHSKPRGLDRCITTCMIVFTFHFVSRSSGTVSSGLFLSSRNPPFSAEDGSSWGEKNNNIKSELKNRRNYS